MQNEHTGASDKLNVNNEIQWVKMSTLEKHLSPQELAERWGFSDTKIRRLFQNEPGVVLVGEPSRRLGKKLRRRYFSMRIPESVAIRVYERMVRKRHPSAKPPQPAPLAAKPPSDSSSVSPEP